MDITNVRLPDCGDTRRPIMMFTLVVDDFGVQYTEDIHAQHLIKCIEEN